MPTYEYLCEDGHRSEVRQSMGDDPLRRCPREECEERAERQIGGGLAVHSGGEASPASRGAEECGPSGFT